MPTTNPTCRTSPGCAINWAPPRHPAVCGDVLVVGTSVHDGEVLPPSPPGDVRGFDLATGELRWTFHTVPRAGEFGVETWGDESWQVNGNTNVWAPMSVDADLGQVYLPVSCPTNNYYGGRRPGDNLFANSVVALGLRHRRAGLALPDRASRHLGLRSARGAQLGRHHPWTGEPIKALAQVSKQGFVYVLDRETGVPVWPIPEVSGAAPPTCRAKWPPPRNPIPTKPPPFVRQGASRKDLIECGRCPGLRHRALALHAADHQGVGHHPRRGRRRQLGRCGLRSLEMQRLYVAGFGPLTHVVRLEHGGRPNFYYGRPELFFGPNTASPYSGRRFGHHSPTT